MTLSPELLAMVADVPAATDEEIALWASQCDGDDEWTDEAILSLIARIVAAEAENGELTAALVHAETCWGYHDHRANKAEAALSALEHKS